MDTQALKNPNKYEFDARFNRIAEDVLTFNGKLTNNQQGKPTSLMNENREFAKKNQVNSKTISYGDYLNQSCPDYQGYLSTSGLYNNNFNTMTQQQQASRNQGINFGQFNPNSSLSASISPPSQYVKQQMQTSYNINKNQAYQQLQQPTMKTQYSNDEIEKNIHALHEKQKKQLANKNYQERQYNPTQNNRRDRYNLDDQFNQDENNQQQMLTESYDQNQEEYNQDQQQQQFRDDDDEGGGRIRRIRNASMPQMPSYNQQYYNQPFPSQYNQYYQQPNPYYQIPMQPPIQQPQQDNTNPEQIAIQKALENQSQLMQKIVEQIQQKKEKEDKAQEKLLKQMTKQLEQKSLEKMMEIKQQRMLELYKNDMQNYVQMQMQQFLPLMHMQQKMGVPPPQQILNNLQGSLSPLNYHQQLQQPPFNNYTQQMNPQQFGGQQNLPIPPNPNQLPMNMGQMHNIMQGPPNYRGNQRVNEILADANLLI